MNQQVFTVYSEPISFGQIQEKSEKKFFVEGFISTSDRDLVDDIVTDGALDSMMEQLKSRVIKLDFEHDSFRGDTDIEKEINKTKMPLAKAVDFMRVKDLENNGVKVRWEFNDTWKKFDSKGDVVMDFPDIRKNIERGFYDAFSIAFIPTKSSFKQLRDGTKLRLLDGMNVLNVALTGNPINPGSSQTNVFLKSLDYLKESESKRRHTPAHKPSADEDEDEDEDNPKKKKKKNSSKKAYDKDGAHAHTDSEPLGMHNHPEIEKVVGILSEEMHDRIFRLSDRVFTIENVLRPKEDSAETVIRSYSKKRHKIQKEVKKVAQENENEDQTQESGSEGEERSEEKPAEKPEGEESAESGAESSSESSGAETEGKAKVNLEVKSRLDAMEKSIKAIENAIIKPVQKAISEQTSRNAQAEGKAVEPLDLI